ncbi:MAG: outer membrane lipoprotein carrier protein LolA [Candidatus Magnetominusculus sp. LBB02]|nr:outer membrane lipoprotein carrier protein LolA [Candidatus Magnetominusculus sp. LBB02]
MRRFHALSAIMLSLALLLIGAAPAATIFERITSAYSTFKDISGRFSQVSKIKELNKEMAYEGAFRLKPPSKMSWKYEGDNEQEVFINGDAITIYKKKLNQAVRSNIDEAAIAQTPLALLRGIADIERDYDVTEKNNVMRLTPKNSSNKVKYFDVYPSKDAFPIKKIVLFDNNDNTVEITLQGVKTNSGLSDELFIFTPPKDAEIINN